MLDIITTVIIVYLSCGLLTCLIMFLQNKKNKEIEELYYGWTITEFIFFGIIFWWCYWLGVIAAKLGFHIDE